LSNSLDFPAQIHNIGLKWAISSTLYASATAREAAS
jgi:hypothetical protein